MDIYNPYRVKGHPVKYNYGLYIGKDRPGVPAAKLDMLTRIGNARKTKYTQRITHRFYMRSYRIGYIEQHFFPQRKVLKIVKKWMRFTEDIKFEDQIPTIGKSLEKTLKEEFLKLQKIVSEYLIDYLATPGTYVRDFSFDDKSGIITNKALIQILFGEDSYKNDGKESKFIVKSLKE